MLLLGGLLAGCHAAEPGGTVSVGGIPEKGFFLFYQAVSGADNRLTVRHREQAFYIWDGAGITAGEGCSQLDPHRARCSDTGINFMQLGLGDGNDVAVNATDIQSTIIGGTGRDTLYGGSDADTFHDPDLDGSDELDADTFDGGSGFDTLQYGFTFTDGINVTLNDVADDGRAGEGDNVLTSIDGVRGTAGPDVLTGDDDTNTFTGGSGDDVLNGLAGSDLLFGGAGFDMIDGGPGIDLCDVEPDGGTATNCE